jgi:2-keto-4-pentenoate hydratase/2-oxohepta-3-ene-1,7-dioic acid hydratase (catechol pathway)
MRLITFRPNDGRVRAGVLLGNTVIDLEAAAPLVFDEAESYRWDMLSLLRAEADNSSLDAAEEIVQAVIDQVGGEDYFDGSDNSIPWDDDLIGSVSIGGVEMVLPLDSVQLLAPLPRPSSIRIFDSFEEHRIAVNQLRQSYIHPNWYERPSFYFGNHNAIYGPEAEIPYPETRSLDYGLSIACVIGRQGRNIYQEDAMSYIAGYTIVNNWVARDIQEEELAIGQGCAKAIDFATSLGPMIVTPDELEEFLLPDERHNLTMIARVNGVERSRGYTRDSFYPFSALVAYASLHTTLYPGDVITSGTVSQGCLLEATAGQGPWLAPNDRVELEISGLGTLVNIIGQPE